MRHMWQSSDDVFAIMINEGSHLSLYGSLDGSNWDLIDSFNYDGNPGRSKGIVSDGIIDADNNLHFVVSSMYWPYKKVMFLKYAYDARMHTWQRDRRKTSVVEFGDEADYIESRATIAMDCNGRMWCAARVFSDAEQVWQIKAYYNDAIGNDDSDLGQWIDSGPEFGLNPGTGDKALRILSFNSGRKIGLIYHDTGYDDLQYKMWNMIQDIDTTQWQAYNTTITAFERYVGEEVENHWSAAGDNLGNVHLAYENGGIWYTRYDARNNEWLERPQYISIEVGSISNSFINNIQYPSISISNNNDIYLIHDNTRYRFLNMRGRLVYHASLYDGNGNWSGFNGETVISDTDYLGYLRMCSLERFNRDLSVIYQVLESPFAMNTTLLFSSIPQ